MPDEAAAHPTAVAHAAAAVLAFGANTDRATRYAELLMTVGIERGLLGPREAERVWSRHMFNSVAVAPMIEPSVRVADLGSGAGLPGIPLALARPDVHVVLLEPMARRVTFLEECVDTLGLSNVSIHRGRAQDGVPGLVDTVVARAVAPLTSLADMAFALCRPDGSLLAIKGAKAGEEAVELARDARFTAVVHTLDDAAGEPATVVEVRRAPKQGRKAP